MDLATAQEQGFVIGLKNESGIQPRLDIDDFMVNDPDCFNLYILALEKLTRDGGDLSDKMGYFQVAGIHGLPSSNWDGVQRRDANGQVLNIPGSYCTHSSFLFPSWHRPYLSMMEQTIYSSIQDIASGFKDPKYHAAAKRFRLPYWDWIKPRREGTTTFPGVRDPDGKTSFPYNYDLPLVCQVPELSVYQPGHEKVLATIRNPLRWYDFPKTGGIPKLQWQSVDAEDAGWTTLHADRSRTTRSPPAKATNRDGYERVNETLNMMRQGSVIKALDLLSTPYDNYLDFSADRPRMQEDQWGNQIVDGPHGSLEDIHNNYHGFIGGEGHMSRVPIAAFDPVFWLHHCNIDRMLTVWQACHRGPRAWLPAEHDEYGQNVPLWPFRAGPGKNDMWNSAIAHTTTAFGYTYTDVQSDPKETLRMWNESYSWSDPRKQRPGRIPQPPSRMMPVSVTKAQVFQSPSETTNPILKTVHLAQKAHAMKAVPDTMMAAGAAAHPDAEVPKVQKLLNSVENPGAEPIVQWYVDLEVQRDAFDGAFSIYIFVGSQDLMRQADQNPEEYSTAPLMAGMTHVFTAPREACDACNVAAERGVIVTGTNPITPMLRDYVSNGTIAGLADDQVVPFLKENLYWRVVAINNLPKNSADVPGLKVTVSSTHAVRQPGEGALTSWESHNHPEITEGRTSGNPVGVNL